LEVVSPVTYFSGKDRACILPSIFGCAAFLELLLLLLLLKRSLVVLWNDSARVKNLSRSGDNFVCENKKKTNRFLTLTAAPTGLGRFCLTV
jgi:hypothetical protein